MECNKLKVRLLLNDHWCPHTDDKLNLTSFNNVKYRNSKVFRTVYIGFPFAIKLFGIDGR